MKNKLKTYNGYRSWNAWNVSLWINNDEGIYFYAMDLIKKHSLNIATKKLIDTLNKKTPDGAIYNRLSIYNTLKELKNN